jgi:tartrate dehydratase beta subunit/fumarate hydratase class I family protein|tara:strand:- start:607 stop:819 length:213 start_codon:yes stop_codon:yes gene_type:complete
MANHPKIEKGFPIPTTRTGKWDWMDKLEVGDSFVVAAGKIATIRNAASRRGMKIATRRHSSNEYRVWRVI